MKIPEALKPALRPIRAVYQGFAWALFHPYYVVRASWPVWLCLNRKGRRLQQNHPRPLDAVQIRIVNELKKNGIAITHLEELFPGRVLFTELFQYTEKLIPNAVIGRKKTFLKYLWGGFPTLDAANPFVRLALEERALEIVNAYMEMYSKLDFYSVNQTRIVPPGAIVMGSQAWHRDPGDKRICKMFLYLSDADGIGAGPFSYVSGSQEGGKWRGLFPPTPEDGYYPPSGDVEKIVPGEDIKICIGRAGTLIFCDTTGLHRGGYSTQKERTMFTAGYSSKNSLSHPIKYRYPENFEEEIKTLTPIQRYAIDNR